MKKIMRITIYVCLCILTSCAEVEDMENNIPDVPETPDVISVTATEAILSEISDDYHYCIQVGTTADIKNEEYEDYLWYSNLISGLKPYMTYYYQAVLSNSVGSELRGEIKSFTTPMAINTPVCSAYYASPDNKMSLSADVMPPSESANILEYGFCLSQTTSFPTLDTEEVITIHGTGIPSTMSNGKTYTITGLAQTDNLKKGVVTYVRAYVKTDKCISYSTESSYYFPVSGIKDNRPYVDLGLPSGTLWTASHYTGTASLNYLPTDSKYYYEENYNPKNFGDFRMPTYEDAKELYDNCTYTRVKLDGHYCAKITSYNGNAIYIPLGGYKYIYSKYDIRIYELGKCGYIWLNSQTDDGYWRIICFSDDVKIGYTYYSYHTYYYSNIRLVLDKQNND